MGTGFFNRGKNKKSATENILYPKIRPLIWRILKRLAPCEFEQKIGSSLGSLFLRKTEHVQVFFV